MLLSRKEIVSLLLFLTAIVSVLNASVFGNVLPLHVSYEQLAHQVVCVGTAYICLIYALSTWLYHSNYSRTRLHMRLVQLCNGLQIGQFEHVGHQRGDPDRDHGGTHCDHHPIP
ncbi:uncharacterized protein LOC117144173 isoform X2 [Drosophila mauritiana]|uniref:Uncharacterized protein LOC117144173 isoform X2 n=1 Tax=Drosophila mauritiana TaxID=7226 RepID=A0A6P8KP00_DROMA|nr:uncharacterized protein LOC117144173 isoform X2 [Drosophila mauritiana]